MGASWESSLRSPRFVRFFLRRPALIFDSFNVPESAAWLFLVHFGARVCTRIYIYIYMYNICILYIGLWARATRRVLIFRDL